MGHDVIWGLRELELLNFTEGGGEWSKDSKEVVELVSKLRSRRDIQIGLRMTSLEPEKVDGGDRLRILSQLLNLIGYKTKFTVQLRIQTENGVIRNRHYAIVPTAQGRHTPPSNIYKPGECVPDSERNYQGSGTFDYAAAREAILMSVDAKYTAWFNSDKSKVKWEVEAVQPSVQGSENLLTTEMGSRHTPPLNIYKPGECVPDSERNYKGSSDLIQGTWEIEASASLVQECIYDPKVGGFETILALTENWAEQFKAAVWNLLSTVERSTVWQMKHAQGT